MMLAAPMSPSDGLPWLPIMVGIALLALPGRGSRIAAVILITLGYLAAFAVGQLGVLALVPLVLLGLAGLMVRDARSRGLLIAGHVLFLILAVALRLHVVPGFANPIALDGRVSPDAIDFRMYLNLDKTLTALWIAAFVSWLKWPVRPLKEMGRGAAVGAASFAAAAVLALLLVAVRPDPKWPEGGWLWALNNLVLVCFAEEAFFRGYLQGGLFQWLEKRWSRDRAAWTSILFGAALFALAHAPSGSKMMGLTLLAGIFYGHAYQRAGLLGAITAHFVLNLLHFTLLTYPNLPG